MPTDPNEIVGIDLTKATPEELEAFYEQLRSQRKRGWEPTASRKRSTKDEIEKNPILSGMSAEFAERILEMLKNGESDDADDAATDD